MKFQDIFDAYVIKARVAPGLLVTAYLISCYTFFFRENMLHNFNLLENIGLGSIATIAGVYFISSSVRGVGRFIIQQFMFNDEKDMPSMKMLLQNNEMLAPSMKEEVLKAINQQFGYDLKSMYTLYEKKPESLKKEIVEVVSRIREITRENKLLNEENISYGFWRNCTGASAIALVAVFIIICTSYILNSTFLVSYILWMLVTLFMFLICYRLTLSSANSYAIKLFRVFVNQVYVSSERNI